MALIVLGSANRDYTVLVDRHPAPGETVLGHSLTVATGGKGANQAVAAARAGAKPVFVGAVGADPVGSEVLADLEARGVNTAHVRRSDQPTGIALIQVDHAGENTIVVAAGANGTLAAATTAATIASLADSTSVLLCQLEIPAEAVSAAASEVAKVGGRFVLNVSPYRYVSPKLLGLADPVILNETEASDLSSSAIDGPADAETIARRLLATCRSVVITLGSDGVVAADSTGVVHLDAARVTVVDTTGAGDAFAGALAAALDAGATLADAARSGISAGTATVRHLGAQPPL
jgi:ribokinase